jgi:hypothetical protein
LMELKTLLNTFVRNADVQAGPPAHIQERWRSGYEAARKHLRQAGIKASDAGAEECVTLRGEWDRYISLLAPTFGFEQEDVDPVDKSGIKPSFPAAGACKSVFEKRDQSRFTGKGATIYRFPRAARRLHSVSYPQIEQHFPSGPTSTNFPFWTSRQIMDRTAEGCACMARLISERLKPFSLLSNRLMSWASIVLSKP